MYRNREEAGKRLAEELKEYKGRDHVLVLAIPRGGVPIAAEVAEELDLAMDVLVIKKIGAPGHEELAAGAAGLESYITNDDVVNSLGLTEGQMEERAKKKQEEVRAQLKELRGDKPLYSVKDKTVIIVDDGVATGSTIEMAVKMVKNMSPKEVIIAVPVAPPRTVKRLEGRADKVVCPQQPESFMAVGQFYSDFRQVSTEEVKEMLGRRAA